MADRTDLKVWRFERLRDGKVMAEGAKVHAETYLDALKKAEKLFWDCPGDTFRLRENHEMGL